jgi:hypothetical protein
LQIECVEISKAKAKLGDMGIGGKTKTVSQKHDALTSNAGETMKEVKA